MNVYVIQTIGRGVVSSLDNFGDDEVSINNQNAEKHMLDILLENDLSDEVIEESIENGIWTSEDQEFSVQIFHG